MKLISGNSNLPLAQEIAKYLEMPLTQASMKRFADMEVFVEIDENIRGEDVFLIQSTCYPANDNLMELLIAMDALRRSSARRDGTPRRRPAARSPSATTAPGRRWRPPNPFPAPPAPRRH